ncbi:MAG: response regulator [Elusimicrobiales bacterium]
MNAAAASTVLVVDDDKNVCEIIKASLAGSGYRSVTAGNGREALEYLKRTADRPGLILLDLMMPEMTGWEFRRRQQADPDIADIPVAIITGLPGVEDKVSAIGAVDVLYKPSRVETLNALASRFCGK